MTKEVSVNYCQQVISNKSNREEIRSMKKELDIEIRGQEEIKRTLIKCHFFQCSTEGL